MNRVLNSMQNLRVEVHTVNGSIYQGYLQKYNEKSIILKAVIIFDSNQFKAIEHAQLELSKITLLISAKFPVVPKRKGKGFTDGEISANKKTQRDLVKFEIPEDYKDDDLSEKGGHWDQFEENEKKFGVTTTYDESIYTTHLDKSSKEYKDKEKEAERIAREIEKSSSANTHMKEERGQKLEDEVDEETKYSEVLRSDLPKPKGATFASIAAKSSNDAKTNETIENAQRKIHAFKTSEKKKVESKKNEDRKKLIEFSKTFKLKTPMPDDIKELLNKKEDKELKLKSSSEIVENTTESDLKNEPKVAPTWNWDLEAPEFLPDEYVVEEAHLMDDSKFLHDNIPDKNVKITYNDLFPNPEFEDSAFWETNPTSDYESLYYMPYYDYNYYQYDPNYYNQYGYDPNYYGNYESQEANVSQ
eukprot:NODE_300_length_10433_cov_0.716470.p4 type:complete len:416 gc:universal NODE_300_length_10433_cov_0.716470:3061-4308(+)